MFGDNTDRYLAHIAQIEGNPDFVHSSGLVRARAHLSAARAWATMPEEFLPSLSMAILTARQTMHATICVAETNLLLIEKENSQCLTRS